MLSAVPDKLLPASNPPVVEVVALASSLGGLHVLTQVLGALPPEFPAALLVLQHRRRSPVAVLSDILATRTPLRVSAAREGEPLKPGTVIVAPADQHLMLGPDRRIHLSDAPSVRFARPSADVLFQSIAAEMGPRAAAVVLTGRLSDGAEGVRAIKRAGGWVIAQDPSTAEADGMPRAALATGCVDYVLSPKSIASALVALTMVPGATALFHRPWGTIPLHVG